MKKQGLIIGPFPTRVAKKAIPGGIATHIDGLLYYLETQGIETFLCYHKPYGIKKGNILNSTQCGWLFAVFHGLLFIFFNKKHNILEYTIKDNLLIAFYISTLRRFLSNNHIDFIHIHSLHNPGPVALDLIKYKGKIIITDHAFWQSKYQHKKNMNKIINNYTIAYKTIYISEKAYKEHLGINMGKTSKLVKISNPTDFSIYPINTRKNSEKKEKIIFFNGYSESIVRKGFDILVSALNTHSIKNNKIRLIAVCDEYAENYIKGKGCNFEYELLGKTTLQNILRIYCNVDLLVVPSRSEGFSLVYTEALAVGIPVVGYFEGIDELKNVLNTYIGESFDPETENEEDLMKKITKCLNAPFDSVMVRGNLIKNYSWNILGPEFLNLYYPNNEENDI